MRQNEARVVESPNRPSEDVRVPMAGVSDQPSVDDEIDLFELMQTIWQGRLKIALLTMLCVLLGAGYAFTATQWFETSFKLSASKEDALFAVNNSELVSVTPQYALQQVRHKLLSAENFKDFYLESKIAQQLLPAPQNTRKEQFAYSVFNNQFAERVTKIKKGDEVPSSPSIEFQLTYPKQTAGNELLSAYLAWTDELIKSEWVSRFNKTRENQLLLNQRNMQRILGDYNKDTQISVVHATESYKYQRLVLQDQLKALKNQLIKKNQQRVLVLDENISIAKRLGFKKPTTPADVKEIRGSSQVSNSGVEIINSEYSGLDKLPMYYRGYESLEAEKIELSNRKRDKFPSAAIVDMEQQLALLEKDRNIEKLQSREQPQAFIDAYVTLQKRNAHLNALQISMDDAELYQLDAKPMASQAAIKPKKLLILVLAAFVGLMMGTLFVLIQGASRKRRAQ
ncbi:MAG: Wzz/FepE/Etk N-terminal domain-containing protein [Bermanella sp.]